MDYNKNGLLALTNDRVIRWPLESLWTWPFSHPRPPLLTPNKINIELGIGRKSNMCVAGMHTQLGFITINTKKINRRSGGVEKEQKSSVFATKVNKMQIKKNIRKGNSFAFASLKLWKDLYLFYFLSRKILNSFKLASRKIHLYKAFATKWFFCLGPKL